MFKKIVFSEQKSVLRRRDIYTTRELSWQRRRSPANLQPSRYLPLLFRLGTSGPGAGSSAECGILFAVTIRPGCTLPIVWNLRSGTPKIRFLYYPFLDDATNPMEDSEIPLYRLLQPEIMCRNELIEVLKRYNLKIDISSADFNELVEIYQKLALPLPQRKYGSTWREKLLTKKQIRLNEGKQCDEINYKIMSDSTSSNPSMSGSRPDRLKPPLDPSKMKEKKLIRLGASMSSKDVSPRNGASGSSKIEVAEVSSNPENEGPECKRKRIKIDFSDSSAKSTPTPKVVSSRRPSTEQDSKEPKSKHRRIVI